MAWKYPHVNTHKRVQKWNVSLLLPISEPAKLTHMEVIKPAKIYTNSSVRLLNPVPKLEKQKRVNLWQTMD